MVNDQICGCDSICFTIRIDQNGNGIFYHSDQQFAHLMGMSQDSIRDTFTKDVFNHAVENTIITLCSCRINEDTYQSENIIIDFGWENKYRIQVAYIKRNNQQTLFRFSGTKLHREGIKSRLEQNRSEYTSNMLSSSSNGIAILHVLGENDFAVKYFDKSIEKLAKTKLEQVYGKSIRQLFPSRKLAGILEACIMCVQTKSSIQFTQRYGKLLIKTTFRPKVENNQVARIIATSVDVTQQDVGDRLSSENRQLRRYENILREQLRFEQVLSKASREFLVAGYKGFDDCLYTMIKQLGRMIRADQVVVVKFKDPSNEVKQWVRKKEFLLSGLYQFTHTKNTSEWCHFLKSNKMLIINDTLQQEIYENFPLKKFSKMDCVRSVIAVPIVRAHEYWGAIFVAQISQSRMWNTVEVSALKLAAETIMSAVLRLQHDMQLEESNHILIEYEKSLQQEMAVQETIYNIAKHFLIQGQSDFDASVNNMLKKLGAAMRIDRLCIYMLQQTDNKMYSAYQWNKKGISSSIDGLQINYSKDVEAWYERLGNVLAVDNTVEDMDCLPLDISRKIISRGLKSFLIVPILDQQNVCGALIFMKIIGHHRWSKEEISMGKECTEIFIHAYNRMRHDTRCTRCLNVCQNTQTPSQSSRVIYRLT